MADNVALIEINKAQQALERANEIHEMVDLRDKFMAIQIFANAQGFKDAAQEAKIYQLKAERKAGEWLKEHVDHRGAAAGNEYQDDTRLPDGVDKLESSRWQSEAAIPEEQFNDWIDRCLSTGKEISSAGLQRLGKDYRREQKREELAEIGNDVLPSDLWSVEQGDISSWQTPKRYDFIITDPPYPREYLPLYDVLGRRAREWLKPGGLLIAMCGQSYLNQIYATLDRHLVYYWTAAYLMPGQVTPLRQRQVNTSWKPLLIYGLDEQYKGKIFGDVFISDSKEKDFHDWGQSLSGMTSIINQICLPGQSILDPFCGAGTTGIAAIKYGCSFDGIDLEEQNVNVSKARLYDSTA